MVNQLYKCTAASFNKFYGKIWIGFYPDRGNWFLSWKMVLGF